MTIDTNRSAIRIRLRGLFLAFLFMTLIVIVLLADFFGVPHFGVSRMHLILFLSVVYVIISLYNYWLNLSYIYYNDDGEKIIFRYYSLRPLSQGKHSIEIPKGTFVKFELINHSLGLKPAISFYQRVKSGVFKYPEVSISLLSNDEKYKLTKSLERYMH
jgi:hypothetical protein